MADVFQWERCDASGAACVDIPGATSSTYLIVSADLGHTLRARGSRDGGFPIVSDPTAVITNPVAPGSADPKLGLFAAGPTPAGFSHLSSYDLVIVSGDGIAAALGMAASRKLLYTNGSSVPINYIEGLSYATAVANGWVLATSSAYGGKAVIDLRIAAARDAMAHGIHDYAASNGMSVFLDDVGVVCPYGVPTPAGWRDGLVAMISQLHALCAADGMYLLANVNGFGASDLGDENDGTSDLTWATQLSLDGVMSEMWAETRNGSDVLRKTGTNFDQHWDGWIAFAEGVQRAGYDFVPLTYGDTAHAVYGYASMLIADQGRGTYIHANRNETDPWFGEVSVGAPTAAKVQSGSVWTRTFTSATATVDSAAATASVA